MTQEEIYNLMQDLNLLKNQLIAITNLIEDCKELNEGLSDYIKSQPFYEELNTIKSNLFDLKVIIETSYNGILIDAPTEVNDIRNYILEILSFFDSLKRNLDDGLNDNVLNYNTQLISILNN